MKNFFKNNDLLFVLFSQTPPTSASDLRLKCSCRQARGPPCAAMEPSTCPLRSLGSKFVCVRVCVFVGMYVWLGCVFVCLCQCVCFSCFLLYVFINIFDYVLIIHIL